MTSGEFRCRVTNDLPRDLAVQRDGSASDGCLLSDFPVFPGILLTCADQLCASIAFDVEPSGTLAITAPSFFRDNAAEAQSEWGRQLLQEVLREAARRRCRTVRFLQPVISGEGPNLMIPLLGEAGFSVRARILQWTAEKAPESSIESSVPQESSSQREVDCEQLSVNVLEASLFQRERVLSLLRRVLTTTQDLVNLPSPDADELLNDWIRQQATIALCRRADEALALCVCVRELPSVDPALGAFRIQYIGVIPEHRGTGAASGLIRRIPRTLLADEDSAGWRILRLTALADASNQAALHLYRACGFEISGECDIWCRDLH